MTQFVSLSSGHGWFVAVPSVVLIPRDLLAETVDHQAERCTDEDPRAWDHETIEQEEHAAYDEECVSDQADPAMKPREVVYQPANQGDAHKLAVSIPWSLERRSRKAPTPFSDR
jgi:hypothetical protein